MSIERCEYCQEKIDTDFNAEHFDDCEYDCECCGEGWWHGGCENTVPDYCPLCTMPIKQLISETLAERDLPTLARVLWSRIRYGNK